MPDYDNLTLPQLQEELKKNEELLQDVKDERAFMAKQEGMHIVTSEFESLDRDRERYEKRIEEIKARIASLGG